MSRGRSRRLPGRTSPSHASKAVSTRTFETKVESDGHGYTARTAPAILAVRRGFSSLRRLGARGRGGTVFSRRDQPPLPEPPAWLIEHGIGAGRPLIRVHVGGCWDTRNRCSAVEVEQARRALAAGVPGCPHRRPHVALGVLD
ncbi:DUF6233 domain-containing protein [Streptomyces sp. LN699]|uniref:DUF6233 domain-containing protein n=1 Tax=Streptomyces sp. LN699 TaxID=3112981 RepID=UPI00371A4908